MSTNEGYHYIMVCTTFPCRILLWISPCNPDDVFQNRIRWRQCLFWEGTLYQIINPYINPLPSSPPWHLPSRLFCYLLRWPAASCFPPKGKLLPLLPSAKATAPPEQSAHWLVPLKWSWFDKQLLPQSRFPRHIQTFSSGKTHVQLYAIRPSFTVSTLSSTDISRPVFPHGFQQLRLLKGRPDTQGSVEKNRNQAPFPTVTQGYWFLFRLVGLQTSQVCTHLGEKCLRSEACRSETSAHTGWMSKEPSHDWR